MYKCYSIVQSTDHSLNVTLVNHLLTNNDVTVTLQWPSDAGVVYSVNISPDLETPHTLLTEALNYNSIIITISFNVQYNISIVSSLCGVTTTQVLNYGK